MNKNYKIITINGVRGIFGIIFLLLGLIAGFIISPAWVCMKFWNTYVTEYIAVANMNMVQGLILWAIIALSLYALNNKRPLFGYGSYPELSQEQIKNILKKARNAQEFNLKNLEIKKEPEQDLTQNEVKEAEKEEIGR